LDAPGSIKVRLGTTFGRREDRELAASATNGCSEWIAGAVEPRKTSGQGDRLRNVVVAAVRAAGDPLDEGVVRRVAEDSGREFEVPP
jgi:hypothetical protein